MRQGIRTTLPQGTYAYEIRGDGFDEPIVLKARITVGDGSVVVDYTGSSPESPYGINCPLNYATAWTVFALKTIASPGIPNNLGSFLPVEIVAPPRTIINPLRPAPVRMRAATAHYIAELLLARDLKVSRIARGLPVGGELEHVDSGTLAQAVIERRSLEVAP